MSKYNSTKIPSLIAAVLSFCNLLGMYLLKRKWVLKNLYYFHIYFGLPESYAPKPQSQTNSQKQIRKSFFNNWWRFHFPITTVSDKLFILFILRFAYGLVFALFETTFGLYLFTWTDYRILLWQCIDIHHRFYNFRQGNRICFLCM